MVENPVSIIVLVHNGEKYIERCITSILNQSFTNFELIILDDFSADSTECLVKGFNDRRINYNRNNFKSTIPQLRNQALEIAKGEYLFITDSDCYVSRHWIEEGMRIFNLKDSNIVGIQGKTFYEVSTTDLRDNIIEPKAGIEYFTCNMAYPKKIILELGKFNEKYTFCIEDLDLAFRALAKGKIIFAPEMIVVHRRRFFDMAMIREHIKRAKNEIEFVSDLIDLLKRDKITPVLSLEQKRFISDFTQRCYNYKSFKWKEYICIFFPFTLYKIRPMTLRMGILIWAKLIICRILYWKTAISNKKLII